MRVITLRCLRIRSSAGSSPGIHMRDPRQPDPASCASTTEDRAQRTESPSMSVTKINTVVIGAGQAGIAMSEHLSAMDVPHVVLERKRIAERWRSERWDSLVANGPAWHDRFPRLKFDDISPEAFPPKE